MKITENLIKSLCGVESLEKIQRLDLSDKDISGCLDSREIQKLKNLNVLDISQNNITEIPVLLQLPNLETLDCSYNNLQSLQFLHNFKNCKQLYIDGNENIEIDDILKVFKMHPSIDFIDDLRRSTVNNFREKWEVMVKCKWEVLFAAKYIDGFEEDKFESILEEFYSTLTSDQLFKTVHDKKDKAILKDVASELVVQARDKTLFSGSGMSKGTPRSARLNHKWFNREDGPKSSSTSTPVSPEQNKTPKSKPSTPKSGRTTPSSRNPLKRARDSTPTESPSGRPAKRTRDTTPTTPRSERTTPLSRNTLKRARENTPTESPSGRPAKRTRDTTPTTPNYTSQKYTPGRSSQLPSVGAFDPVFFIRCHSVDNDPNDETTKVWRCAFEPSTDVCSSQMLATCGGPNVCLIDCQTGKVMKRYKDTNKEEDFYALAWSTIPYRTDNKKDRTNILAVAGNSGYIKLIHPSQLVMYATMEGHHDYISCLLFHPTEPTYLFSGSKDRKIILWDVGIPDFTDYTTNYKKLITLNVGHTDALNLIYSPESHILVAGCEKSCYGWNCKDIKKVSRDPNVEFMIPSTLSDIESGSGDEVETVDGLALLPNNYIASRCSGSGHLIIWNLHDNLPVKYQQIKDTRHVEVKASSLLAYTKTCVDYINLGSCGDMLTVGDDKGSVFLYSIGLLTSRPELYSDEEIRYSWKLEWPELNCGSNKEKIKDLGSENIVINSCCSSEDHQLVACGTDNNLVCIWKKNGQLFC